MLQGRHFFCNCLYFIGNGLQADLEYIWSIDTLFIVRCGKCGTPLTRAVSNTKDNYYNLRCPNRNCDNVSAPMYLIEQKLLEALQDWLDGYELEWEKEGHTFHESAVKKNALRNYEKELE